MRLALVHQDREPLYRVLCHVDTSATGLRWFRLAL